MRSTLAQQRSESAFPAQQRSESTALNITTGGATDLNLSATTDGQALYVSLGFRVREYPTMRLTLP